VKFRSENLGTIMVRFGSYFENDQQKFQDQNENFEIKKQALV